MAIKKRAYPTFCQLTSLLWLHVLPLCFSFNQPARGRTAGSPHEPVECGDNIQSLGIFWLIAKRSDTSLEHADASTEQDCRVGDGTNSDATRAAVLPVAMVKMPI